MEKHNISEQEIRDTLSAQPQLALQSFETLKGEITPVTKEIMSRQATINIGKNIYLMNRNNRSRGPWKDHSCPCHFRYSHSQA